MNIADFYSLLNNPNLLKNKEKSLLEQWIRNYPYFQTAYLLAAKKSIMDRESSFELKLDVAAAYAVDRVKLFDLINEQIFAGVPVPVEKIETRRELKEVPASGDEALDELLRSIHERKQSILSREEAQEVTELQIAEDAESLAIDELRSAGSEYAPSMGEIPENEEAYDPEIFSLELEMMRLMDQVLADQEEYESTEELIVLNELGGGGSEYLPFEELLEEEAEEFFVEEVDPEVASISVLEEEFVLHDLDLDVKENEVLHLSEAEALMQIDQESNETMEIMPDPELLAMKEMEMEWNSEDEYNKHEELLTINEAGGGGSEFIMVEINEEEKQDEPIVFISESDALMVLEVNMEEHHQITEKFTVEETPSLRFSEHVESPGAFLPEKSYTFLEWLHFFKAEPSKEKKVESKEEPVRKSIETQNSEVQQPEGGMKRTGFREELETIDKIVSTLKHEAGIKYDHLISPSDLAKKSLETDEELVSETLARIYEEQGLIDKAIRQYVKLSLKFPEKSLSFAARITELKSKK